ncbi:hypothetical protein DIPPA_18675 [Diplonema papillatum]|nr:hypothetical protein DIPPA_18675 [Diplonema papillatum]|eukprot:gene3134-4932_t
MVSSGVSHAFLERQLLSPPAPVMPIYISQFDAPAPVAPLYYSGDVMRDLAIIRPAGIVQNVERPCPHNQWKKQTKKRGRLVLRCTVCSSVWKTRPELHQKCSSFHAGRCELGDECPHPHIYARRETSSLLRRKAKLAQGDDDDASSDAEDLQAAEGEFHIGGGFQGGSCTPPTDDANHSDSEASSANAPTSNSSTTSHRLSSSVTALDSSTAGAVDPHTSCRRQAAQTTPTKARSHQKAKKGEDVLFVNSDKNVWRHNPYSC